ncbi:hypothetical protein JTB14_035797 [Gonioctena quinquepunctata]|nr:hypothetical protein JTB14_035797 [Gonioctena quinquepunctata]
MEMDLCDIKKISDRTPVTIPETENVWGEFDIPFTTLEGLTSFEEYLSNGENMRKSITELSRIWGDNANEFMKRAMSKLITHKLAAEFSWVGLKKKIFSKMYISNLLIRSAQQNGKSSASTIKEMEDGIRKVLRRAAERAIAEEKRLDSYLEARKKSNVAEYTCDLNIEEGPATRKNCHRRTKTIESSSDDEQPSRIIQKRMPILPKPPTRPINEEKENTPPMNESVAAIAPDVCCCCPAHKQIVQTGTIDMNKIKKQYLFMTNIMADIKSELSEIKAVVVSPQQHPIPPLNESIFKKISLPINDEGALEVLGEYLR